MPDNAEEGIVKGMYTYEYTPDSEINLLGSGAIMAEVLDAAQELRSMGKSVNVWSVTSYTELSRQALRTEREQLLSIGDSSEKPYVSELLESEPGVFVAASDYQKALPLLIAPWIKGEYIVLGTDGFGLSESREDLRDYFEVSSNWIVFAALSALAQSNREHKATALDFASKAGLDLGKAAAT